MDQMPILVYKDVSIMPIFDLEEVRDNRITRERTDKITLGTSESTGIGFTKCLESLSAELQEGLEESDGSH